MENGVRSDAADCKPAGVTRHGGLQRGDPHARVDWGA